MKKAYWLLLIATLILIQSCYTPREGVVLRHTRGSAYKVGGSMREQTKIPAPWK